MLAFIRNILMYSLSPFGLISRVDLSLYARVPVPPSNARGSWLVWFFRARAKTQVAKSEAVLADQF